MSNGKIIIHNIPNLPTKLKSMCTFYFKKCNKVLQIVASKFPLYNAIIDTDINIYM